MPDFSIVDTHVHLWNPSLLNYGWIKSVEKLNRQFLPSDFRDHCGSIQVDKMVFLECDPNSKQFVDEAKWVVSLTDEEPRIKGIVAHAPLHKGVSAKDDLEKLVEIPLVKGVRRLIQSESLGFCLDSQFVEGIQALSDFGLSFDLCIFHPQLSQIVKLVRQCPQVQFVLDHIGKPGIKDGVLEPWRSELRQLGELPNIWCKISGLVTEADPENWTADDLKPYIDNVIEIFGFDRVMYGGDWPVSTLATTYPTWVETLDWALNGSSEDELHKLYRDNANTFYRL